MRVFPTFYLYCLRRLTRFPPYCVTMRVFFTFFCTRVSLSFKTPYAFSSVWHHNACVLLACLHRFRRLSRFLRMGSKCVNFTRLSVSFKTPYAVSSVFATQCVCFSRFSALAFLFRFRRLTRFPLYGMTMRVFYWRFCIVLDVLRVFLRLGS